MVCMRLLKEHGDKTVFVDCHESSVVTNLEVLDGVAHGAKEHTHLEALFQDRGSMPVDLFGNLMMSKG